MLTVRKREASEDDAPPIKEESVADKVSSVAAASLEEELECENCNERYYESKNDDDNACMWYSTTHKGMYLCDYESEF